jgi:hypothetical protein
MFLLAYYMDVGSLTLQRESVAYSKFLLVTQALVRQATPGLGLQTIQRVPDSSGVVLVVLEALEVRRPCFIAYGMLCSTRTLLILHNFYIRARMMSNISLPYFTSLLLCRLLEPFHTDTCFNSYVSESTQKLAFLLLEIVY